MKKLDDQTLIDGLINNDSKVIEYIYDAHFPVIRKMVKRNKGCEADAKDIFQTSLEIIFKKIRVDDLILISSFLTYQYAICRNTWYNELKLRKLYRGYFIDTERLIEISSKSDLYEKFKLEIKYDLFNKHFKTLSKLCRDIISLYLRDCSVKQIAKELNCPEEITIRRQKYDCKMTLINRIRKDPKYYKLEQYDN